jgi:uncharacterized membrane protein YfhO
MNKLKLRERLVFILSFLLPSLALILIFAVKEIYPFGDNSFLRTDMYHQYAPFFSEFADKLQNGGSLLYSWKIGAGSNFITLLAYYLCSPFNLLLVFLSKPAIIEFMTYLIVFKTGLCGLSMAWYLCRRFSTRNICAALFAMGYALSGYMAAYSWNIMWLDCIWLAPLVLLGLELLVEENKGLMYCITLALSILTNYYISIMLCMFLVLYFLCLLILHPSRRSPQEGEDRKISWKDYAAKCLRFAGYSLLAGGLAAVLLIPVMLALKTTASSNINFPDKLNSYFPMIDMLARHMAGVETEIGLDHWPNLYSCAAVFVLMPLYIMNRNISYKEKIVKCSLLLFLLVSFAWNIPNFIWHGFHYPNSLPCRQSFLYTILLLTMCFEALKNLRTASVNQIVGSLWGAVAFIFLCEKVVDAEEFRFYAFYINIVLVGFYGLLLYLHKRRRVPAVNVIFVAMGLVFLEMGLNMGITSITTTGRTAYLRGTPEFGRLAAIAEEQETGFFRMEKAVKKTKNDGAWAGYRSASIFSSTTNSAITTIYRHLGMEGSTNAYSFTGATPFVSALLSVKYTLAEKPDAQTPLTSFVATDGDFSLYRNEHVLPLGFMIPASAENWNHLDTNPIQVQNSFVSSTTSRSEIFTMVDTGSSTSYTFTAPQDGYYYGVLTDFSVKNVTAVSDDGSTTYNNVDRDFILDLGYMRRDEEVTLSGNDQKTVSLNIYRLLQEEFIAAVAELNEEPLVVDSYTDTQIRSHITVQNDGILFTSIPYEEGWQVFVDGQTAETSPYADAFLSVALTAGEHTIVMNYMPVGFKAGAILSGVSLAILLLLILIWVRKWRKKNQLSLDEQRRLRFPKKDGAPSGGEIPASAQNESREEDSSSAARAKNRLSEATRGGLTDRIQTDDAPTPLPDSQEENPRPDIDQEEDRAKEETLWPQPPSKPAAEQKPAPTPVIELPPEPAAAKDNRLTPDGAAQQSDFSPKHDTKKEAAQPKESSGPINRHGRTMPKSAEPTISPVPGLTPRAAQKPQTPEYRRALREAAIAQYRQAAKRREPVPGQAGSRDRQAKASAPNKMGAAEHEQAASRHEQAAARHEQAADRHEKAAARHERAASRHEQAAARHEQAAADGDDLRQIAFDQIIRDLGGTEE